MATIEQILEAMRVSPKSVKFTDCLKVCIYYFGKARISGSHFVFKTPWKGEPWVNIQMHGNEMKPYQVKQVLSAIDKLKDGSDDKS